MIAVYQTKAFIKSAKHMLRQDTVQAIAEMLATQPLAGSLIAHSGGLRKLRVPRPGMGKRGGARVIYYFVSAEGAVYLLYAYAKADSDDLTKDQYARLRAQLK